MIDDYSKKWKLNHIDYIVLGEGESTFLEIIHNMSKNQEKEVLGAIKVKDSTFIYPGDRNKIFNMNTLLLPDFSDFNMSLYDFIPINTSRGCIKRCVFCKESKYWKFYHSMSPEKIFSEIKTLKEKHKISNFRFTDSLVNASIKNLELLCDFLINSSLNIKWRGYARLDPMMDRKLLKKNEGIWMCRTNFWS